MHPGKGIYVCKSSEAGEAQFVWKKQNKTGISLMVQWLGLLRVWVQSSLAGGPRSHKLHGEANKTKAKESLSAGGRVAEDNVS